MDRIMYSELPRKKNIWVQNSIAQIILLLKNTKIPPDSILPNISSPPELNEDVLIGERFHLLQETRIEETMCQVSLQE